MSDIFFSIFCSFVLGSLQSALSILSADDVNPSAVLQIEAFGKCYQVNGPLALKLPDFLVRSESVRLGRLLRWVGWKAGVSATILV